MYKFKFEGKNFGFLIKADTLQEAQKLLLEKFTLVSVYNDFETFWDIWKPDSQVWDELPKEWQKE